MIGPVVKIRKKICRAAKIFIISAEKITKNCRNYLAGWDVAMMPFAINDSTKFISPTKTPEYLAAGKPVVRRDSGCCSTIRRQRIGSYCDDGGRIRRACEKAMREETPERVEKADEFLAQMSWEQTWNQMAELIRQAAKRKKRAVGSELKYLT
jgi:hypothetical protein